MKDLKTYFVRLDVNVSFSLSSFKILSITSYGQKLKLMTHRVLKRD